MTLHLCPAFRRTQENRNSEVNEALEGLVENVANLQLDIQEMWGRIAEFRSMFPQFNTEDQGHQNQNERQAGSSQSTTG